MYCRNCGNKIENGEKFCGKCGNEINIRNNKQQNKKFTIKLWQIILIVIILIIVIGFLVTLYNGNSELLNNSQSIQQISNTTDTNINNNNDENTVLDCIDEGNKEFKINVNELSNELKEIEKKEAETNRSSIKFEYECIKSTTSGTDRNGQLSNAYLFGIKNLASINDVYPFIFATHSNDNIYRISVLHPYLNDYGTDVNYSAIEHSYKILYNALDNLGYSELSSSIKKIQEEIKNMDSVSEEYNVKGVHVGLVDAGTNKYNNSKGIYMMYGAQ